MIILNVFFRIFYIQTTNNTLNDKAIDIFLNFINNWNNWLLSVFKWFYIYRKL